MTVRLRALSGAIAEKTGEPAPSYLVLWRLATAGKIPVILEGPTGRITADVDAVIAALANRVDGRKARHAK